MNVNVSHAYEVNNITIDGPHGPLPLRTYQPPRPTAGLVWVHGGAFAFGGLDDAESDWVARKIASTGIAVVTVDYSLAPVPQWMADVVGIPARSGVTYPIASEEIDAAFRWARTTLTSVPSEAWSLGGASAGAALVAGAALRLRDQRAGSPRRLILIYGLFHAVLPELRPDIAAAFSALPPELAILTPDVVQAITLNYVDQPVLLGERYAFAGGHDLTGLPPTLLVNSESDSIRASGQRFAAELADAGIDIQLMTEPGVPHGHLSDPDHPGATRTVHRMTHWLQPEPSAPSPQRRPGE